MTVVTDRVLTERGRYWLVTERGFKRESKWSKVKWKVRSKGSCAIPHLTFFFNNKGSERNTQKLKLLEKVCWVWGCFRFSASSHCVTCLDHEHLPWASMQISGLDKWLVVGINAGDLSQSIPVGVECAADSLNLSPIDSSKAIHRLFVILTFFFMDRTRNE